MPPVRKVDKLPTELKQWLQDALKARGFGDFIALTEDLNFRLEEEGLELRIGKSAIHAYSQEYEEFVKYQNEASAWAADWMNNNGLEEEAQRHNVLFQMITTLAFKVMQSQMTKDMGRRFGLREAEDSGGLIWAIKFSQEWYRLQMPPLKVAFEDDMIAIGRDADHLTDLRKVTMIRGIPRVPDIRETDAKGKKRHGDYAIALALAHFASRMRWVEYDYRPVDDGRHAESGYEFADDADTGSDRSWWSPPLGSGLRGGI
jgi:uncharacterized protein DUF3486